MPLYVGDRAIKVKWFGQGHSSSKWFDPSALMPSYILDHQIPTPGGDIMLLMSWSIAMQSQNTTPIYTLRINPSKQIYWVKTYAHFQFQSYLVPRCLVDSGLAGEVGEGIPDGGNSMSSRMMGIFIQQQRELPLSGVWRMGKDASWQVLVKLESWGSGCLFFSKDLDSSWIHGVVLNCTNEAYVHYLVEKVLWIFQCFLVLNELSWKPFTIDRENTLSIELWGTKLSILERACFLWTATKVSNNNAAFRMEDDTA